MVLFKIVRVIGADCGNPYLLVSNSGVTLEDQGDFELVIQFDRNRGDRKGPLLEDGQEVSFLYELALPTMADLEVMEKVLSKVLWGPVGTPTVTERK